MSLKKNFIYSSILTTSQYLFPLLTYPYVSRVLGVTNIGVVNYVDSLVNYFILPEYQKDIRINLINSLVGVL